MLICALTVWWHRGRYNISRIQLSATGISLSGCNRGDEDDPNSCNGGPSGATFSSCDD